MSDEGYESMRRGYVESEEWASSCSDGFRIKGSGRDWTGVIGIS